MTALLQRISNFILEQKLCQAEDHILLAISGGPDSVFLAFAMRLLGYKIGLAHINYQLRGEESEQEEALVRNYASIWEVPLFVKNLNTREIVEDSKGSLQEVARKIRYDFFEKIPGSPSGSLPFAMFLQEASTDTTSIGISCTR